LLHFPRGGEGNEIALGENRGGGGREAYERGIPYQNKRQDEGLLESRREGRNEIIQKQFTR